MGFAAILGREIIEKGLTAKHDRNNKFRLVRVKNDHGFYYYLLENQSREERLGIKQYLFDRLRIAICRLPTLEKGRVPSKPIDIEVTYNGEVCYTIRTLEKSPQQVVIHDLRPERGFAGVFSFDLTATGALVDLLFSNKVKYANEVLSRIIAYHKLFQFTFAEGSESMTSDLAIKRGVLGHHQAYIPALGKRNDDPYVIKDSSDFEEGSAQRKTIPKSKRESDQQLFKSRLAERSADSSYQINFSDLFKSGKSSDEKSIPLSTAKDKRDSTKSDSYPLPLLSSEIKRLAKLPFKCEFSSDDIKELRDDFIGDRNNEFYIGFEILDVVYRKESGRLRTFRFPLYYMKVSVSESGRTLIIDPNADGRFFLNHLALTNAVEEFGKASAGRDRLDEFFNNLLAQTIEIEGKRTRSYITRLLPINEEIFQRTREILLGFPGENGKGGLLSSLNVLGIECDLESVALYKVPKVSSQMGYALEGDLEQIRHIATEFPQRFSTSLLGQFLTPELRTENSSNEKFSNQIWIPGALPKSTRQLLNRIETSQLTLLEGPPGTGKTFTILNLFIHCLCSGKRLLIVSDQKSAIHALTEKIVEYLVGRDRTSQESLGIIALWENAIKVIDELPAQDTPLPKWINDLRAMLKIDSHQIGPSAEVANDLDGQLAEIDRQMATLKVAMQAAMELRMGADAQPEQRVSTKRFHATTAPDIDSLCQFLAFLRQPSRTNTIVAELEPSNGDLMKLFIEHRRRLSEPDLKGLFAVLDIPDAINDDLISRLVKMEELLLGFDRISPRTTESLNRCLAGWPDERISSFLRKAWTSEFLSKSSHLSYGLRIAKSLFHYPLSPLVHGLRTMISNQRMLLLRLSGSTKAVIQEVKAIHSHLHPDSSSPSPLSLEICYGMAFGAGKSSAKEVSVDSFAIQEYLMSIEDLQSKRDDLVRLKVHAQMAKFGRFPLKMDGQGGTSLATTIAAILDSLKVQRSLDDGSALYRDLQKKLLHAFPIWICRKQAVPFLFSCVERSFDLIIVDEATQCRVDDALPLLFRAKKILVVGDEKQTVLAKNSVVDDYLFREFRLEEHLRQTQARGIKGGGSHLFGLVKAIKQGHVMLDEHYRCPPDIIQYSNQYVYNNELRNMQWTLKNAPRSLEVDFSEETEKSTGKRESGKFKGIETLMVDRFFSYIERTIARIEAETGQRINVETDVAICYFLLKNEPYIKQNKGEFLRRLNRGQDVLDGAGAALQGKERDYIFYFWDINRGNMMSFKQGDDVDKRRGELNVLMSRPKKKAFHFLHKDFRTLDHSKASITDFLWKAYHRQMVTEAKSEFAPRLVNPGPEFVPWRRSSGQLISSMVDQVLALAGWQNLPKRQRDRFVRQYSVTVGDPRFCVDFMLSFQSGRKDNQPAIGVVDLSSFDGGKHSAEDIVDYYFQLQRATPHIRPLFLFLYELADINSRGHEQFLQALTEIFGKSGHHEVA